ncbi:MAG: heme exporter protein CcmD [Gammaproteobacteria bacterium]
MKLWFSIAPVAALPEAGMVDALLDFLRMGGYARYVWPPYLFAAALLLANFYFARRRLRRARDDIARREE